MKKITSVFLALCLIVALAAQIAPTWALAEDAPDDEPIAGESPVEVSNYEELVEAILDAEEGDSIIVTGVIEIAPYTTFNDMGKNLTLRRDNPTAAFVFSFLDDDGILSEISGFTFDGAEIESSMAYISLWHGASFHGTSFVNCISTSQGGAVDIGNIGTSAFTNCRFDGNTAVQGSHINIGGATVSVIDCTFNNGKAQNRGGAVASTSQLTISGSTFTGNHAGILGGAIFADGALSIETTKFIGNSADIEGGADIAADGTGLFKMKDNLESLASLYAPDGLVPLGWVYDYSERPMTFRDTVYLPQYVQLKMKFQNDTPPVDPEPVEPEEPVDPEPEEPTDPDPVDPTPTDPEEPDKPDPDETPSPEPSEPSYSGGNGGGYVVPQPIEKQTTQPRLACGEAVLDPSRTDYLVGFADGASGRNMPLTRAKAVQAIFRLLTPDSLKKVYSESGVFVDVSADDWHSVFVNTLQKSGVVAGCGNGLFKPERFLTWGEMVTLFTRFTNAKPDKPLPLQHRSADAVSVAASLGWMEYHSGFNPDAEVTIEEFTDFASGVLSWATTP